MRSVLPLIVVALLALAVVGGASSPDAARAAHPCFAEQTFGDVADNGEVGSEDALYILSGIAGVFRHERGCSSEDVNCDGSVTAVDALAILRYVAGLPYSQDEPCPEIGEPLPP